MTVFPVSDTLTVSNQTQTKGPNIKLRLLSFFLLLCATLATRAQIVLNEGDVWDYHFTSMTQVAFNNLGNLPTGFLAIYHTNFTSGTLQWEVWQGLPEGPPMAGGLIHSPTNNPSRVQGWGLAWQDFEGSVRLTMLSGQCTVDSVVPSMNRPQPPPIYVQTWSAPTTSNSPSPRLQAQRFTNAVAVSWWTNGTTGYVLESANVIPTNQWTLVPTAPIVVSNRYVVNVGTNESAAYFRLRK